MRTIKIFKGNGSPIISKKVGRNAKFPCGSGLKAKNCHGTETKYYDSKPTIKPEPVQS